MEYIKDSWDRDELVAEIKRLHGIVGIQHDVIDADLASRRLEDTLKIQAKVEDAQVCVEQAMELLKDKMDGNITIIELSKEVKNTNLFLKRLWDNVHHVANLEATVVHRNKKVKAWGRQS